MTINCKYPRCKDAQTCLDKLKCMGDSLAAPPCSAWQPIGSLPLEDIRQMRELLFAYDDGVVCSMAADEAEGIVIGEKKGWYVGKLTHWMPLPEPPNGGKHE